jgi:hypothetical protein
LSLRGALSITYPTQNFRKRHFKMLLLFEQKMTYMQIIFENFPKNLSPSTLWNEVVARRTLKIIENGQ